MSVFISQFLLSAQRPHAFYVQSNLKCIQGIVSVHAFPVNWIHDLGVVSSTLSHLYHFFQSLRHFD